MKKIILTIAGLIGLMVAGNASAAFSLIPGSNDYRMVDCTLLANDTELVLTSNVVGGIQCDSVNNFIALSVCHTSGQVNERSAVVLDPNDTPNDPTDDCDPTTDANGCVVTVSGAAFPTATTARGTVASAFPEQTCEAANVESYVDAIAPPQ